MEKDQRHTGMWLALLKCRSPMLLIPKCVTHSQRADSLGKSLSGTMRSARLEEAATVRAVVSQVLTVAEGLS